MNTELRLLVMSATIEAAPVARLLNGAPVIECAGRQFAVETRYIERATQRAFEPAMAEAVLSAGRSEPGSILVFLPGAAEIRRVLALLNSAGLGNEWSIAPLFGNLSKEEQDQAIAPPPPGRRKIVLATNIAETSLTIEGIRVVVDGGLMRAPRFDVRSGMTRLATIAVSRASADQRRGRAGRTEPGVCYRLWSEAMHATLAERNSPEIVQADLAALSLELALWGVPDPSRLKWLDPPPEAAFRQACGLLKELGALDEEGRATPHGRRMAELPLHPRLAHMLLEGKRRGMGAEACDLAAVLSERDFLRFPVGEYDSDLGLRLDVMAGLDRGRDGLTQRFTVDRSGCRRCKQLADAFRLRQGLAADQAPRREIGRMLSWAYPDRIGQRRPGAAGRFLLANGRGAFFPSPEPLAAADYIVAADLDGERQEARVFLSAACDLSTILEDFRFALQRTGDHRLGQTHGGREDGKAPVPGRPGPEGRIPGPSGPGGRRRGSNGGYSAIRHRVSALDRQCPALAGAGALSEAGGRPGRRLAGCLRSGPDRCAGALVGAPYRRDHAAGRTEVHRPYGRAQQPALLAAAATTG